MRIVRFKTRMAALFLLVLLIAGCGDDDELVAVVADRDGDGVADSQDGCPDLAAGSDGSGGCPWYKVDACSGSSPYTLAAHPWSTMTPTYHYSTSLPTSWMTIVDVAAGTWNAAGSRLQIRRSSTPISAGVGLDGKSVVSYGPLSTGGLGATYTWYNTATGLTVEADIRLNSNQPWSNGGSSSTFDIRSALVHEFGHFVRLDHVNDRTHTMFTSMPMGCSIYRTLCTGDRLGLSRRYP